MASILTAVALILAAPQAPPAASAHRDSVAALVDAERRWMDAARLRNAAALRRYVAPEFTLSGLTDLSRAPLPAAKWLDNTLRHLRIDSFRFGGMKAQIAGDVGIVRAGYRWSGAFDGARFDDRGALVDIWVRRQGRWVVVSRVIADSPPAKP
ncbi:MAG: hypothetical protein JWO81_3480 [Alphaproteobacteria bacterium]|nr:hypothetical protein [Alphaproteobacteria bacterium]